MRPDEIDNPAWDYIKNCPNEKWASLIDGRFSPAGWEYDDSNISNVKAMRFHRSRATTLWSWAIPDPAVLDFILKAEGVEKGIVELGAGNGYWAHLLTQLGLDVKAYDAAPIGHEGSWFGQASNHTSEDIDFGEEPREWHPVEQGSIEVLDLPENHDRVLFLCWPNYNTSFAFEAVERFKGAYVIYIGEGQGGCNADDHFFDLMGHTTYDDDFNEVFPANPEWEEVGFHSMVQWSGLHDNLTIYRRKSHDLNTVRATLAIEGPKHD